MKPTKSARHYAAPACAKCGYSAWREFLAEIEDLDTVEVAQAMRVSRDLVYKWRRCQRGPGPDTLRRAALWLGKEW